jgi:hypothetical protein
MNRVTLVAESVVQPTQTAFMPGRHILEGVVILHETIHELHRKNMDGILLKEHFMISRFCVFVNNTGDNLTAC